MISTRGEEEEEMALEAADDCLDELAGADPALAATCWLDAYLKSRGAAGAGAPDEAGLSMSSLACTFSYASWLRSDDRERKKYYSMGGVGVMAMIVCDRNEEEERMYKRR